VGGPGAVFWLAVSGVLGMSTKFAEIAVAMQYRQRDSSGIMRGGAMYVLAKGLKMPWLGTIFAALTGLAGFGIGNMVQANDANGLAVITQLQPIAVLFNIPQDDLPHVLKKMQTGQKLVVEAYNRTIEQRAKRIPLQYITGTTALGNIDVEVGPGVFVPRPETELLLGWALAFLEGVDRKPPVILDLEIDGKMRKVVVQANRNGFYYILDRVTGEFLHASPFVDKLTWASGIDENGRPMVLPGQTPTPEGVETCPTVRGAANWMSDSYNPDTGLLYVMTLEACDIYVTPYFNLQQSTSGTLSYAVALGKAVVSTPYLHAIELLAGDAGRLIEPDSAPAIAEARHKAAARGISVDFDEADALDLASIGRTLGNP